MNEFDYIDYKTPIGIADDHRTSYHIAHKYIPIPTEAIKKSPQNYGDKYMYKEDPILKLTYRSECHENYTWKKLPLGAPRYSSLSNSKFVKCFVEKQMKFIPRPLKPAISVSHEDYQKKAITNENKSMPLQQKVEPATVINRPIVVNPAQPGALKYLDPCVTTYKLNYVYRTPNEVLASIANMDNVTFWNWNQVKTKLRNISNKPDVQMCNYVPSKQCSKDNNQERTLPLHVPNTGMTTELRDNFNVAQLKRVIDEQQIHNNFSYIPMVPLATDTESNIIGSGHRVQRYVA